MQNVIRRHHEDARFQLRLERQRHVHGHLVAVEVGVEGRADQRMQLDRLALDELGLKGLDAKAMQRRGAVQHHRMLADNLIEDVQTSGFSFSTSFLACFTVAENPWRRGASR